jgi:hypothetical protein
VLDVSGCSNARRKILKFHGPVNIPHSWSDHCELCVGGPGEVVNGGFIPIGHDDGEDSFPAGQDGLCISSQEPAPVPDLGHLT